MPYFIGQDDLDDQAREIEWIEAGAPSPSKMFDALRDGKSAADVQPLTVAQAAKRENVSPRTVYRWLEDGELGDGAWKVGSAWRIDPAALDRRRVQGPKPRNPRTRNSAPVTIKGKPAAAASNEDWPI